MLNDKPMLVDKPVLIDKPGIARLIPHTGAMCLLDGVHSWNETHIQCVTATHLSTDNPLRRSHQLGILSGVEYAAQAMALHGALADNDDPVRAPVGYLASLRSIVCHAGRLDLLPGVLLVEAACLHREPTGALYNFILRHKANTLLEGRAAVIFTTT